VIKEVDVLGEILPEESEVEELMDMEEEEFFEEDSLDSVRMFFQEMGSKEVLPPEEQTSLVAAFQRGLEAARCLAQELGIELEELRRWVRRKLAERPLEGDHDLKCRLMSLAKEHRLKQHLLFEGEEALNKLVEHNLRFILYIAKSYKHPLLSITDLVEAGVQGILEAAIRFDLRKKLHFSTYAYWRIRLRVGQTATKYGRVHASLDEPVELDGQTLYGELIASGEDLAEEVTNRVMKLRALEAMNCLLPDERRLLELTEGLNGDPPLKVKQAAQCLGLKEETARSHRLRAINKLRTLLQ